MRTRLFPLMLLASTSIAVPLGAETPIFPMEITRSGLGLQGPVQIVVQMEQRLELDTDAQKLVPRGIAYFGYEFDARGNTIARYTFDPARPGVVISFSAYRREGDTIFRLDYGLGTELSLANLAPTSLRQACEAARIESSRSIGFAWRIGATGLVLAMTDAYKPGLPESSWTVCSYDSQNRLARVQAGSTSLSLTHSGASTTIETASIGRGVIARELWTWEGADPVTITRTPNPDPNRRIEYQRDSRGNTVLAIERGSTGLVYRAVQSSYFYEGDPVASPPREISRGDFQSRVLDLAKSPPASQGARVAVVEFYADWAKPSSMMHKVMREAAATKGMNADFYMIDVDKEPDLANSLGITSIPTVIVYAPGKAPVTRVGVIPLESFLKTLSELGALSKQP